MRQIINPKINASLTEEKQATAGAAHERLIGIIAESGEMVSRDVLDAPAKNTLVRVGMRDRQDRHLRVLARLLEMPEER